MRQLNARHQNPRLAFLLTLPLIALTTWLLTAVQQGMTAHEGHYVRAYGIAYLLPVAALTVIGGRRPGVFALAVAMAALDFALVGQRFAFTWGHAPDWVEMGLTSVIGAALVFVLGSLSHATQAARDAEQSVQEALVRTRSLADRQTLLNRIGDDIRGTLDPAVIEQRTVRSLGEILRVDRCYFSLYDIPGDSVHVGQDWHRADLVSLAGDYRISDYGTDPQEQFRSGEPQVVRDVREGSYPEALLRTVEQLGLRSGVSVPLFRDGTLVAVLAVAMAEQTRDWTEEEVSLVKAVAALTRTAVEVAHFHQREHNIAETLQGALLPAIPEGIPGLDIASYYRAALSEASVGGDFADVFALEKGCYALVVGDLSGKGLAAASQVATVRNMLRFSLYTASTIAEAVTRLNNVLMTNNLLTGFATLVVLAYDVGMRTVTHVSCGHEPALLRRRANGDVEELPPTGPILGAYESAQYEEQVLSMEVGDAFVLYTDGLTESGPSRREMMGVAGLAALLREGSDSAAALVAHLMAGVEAHARGVLTDDVCLLAGIVEERSVAANGQS